MEQLKEAMEHFEELVKRADAPKVLEICGNTGAAQRFLKCLERAMKTAAARQRYEEAARYRDLIQDWTYLKRELNAYEDFLTKDAVYGPEPGGGL